MSSSRHLLNPLANLNQLVDSPSRKDGINYILERDLRFYGAVLIQQAGVMLNAPQVVMSTAQVLFQRFWFVTSLKHFGIRDIGLGALFLASKLEESPLRIRDLINSYDYLLNLSQHCSSPPYPPPSTFTSYTPMDYFAPQFYDRKDALVIAEMQILKRLGFQTQVSLPYGHLINYLKVLELSQELEVIKQCWGYLNDLLQTPAPALYPESTLALATIYLSTRLVKPTISLPLTPVPWWSLFDSTEEELIAISRLLLTLYRDWEGENVWTKGATLPISKEGVRELIKVGTKENGNEDVNGVDDII